MVKHSIMLTIPNQMYELRVPCCKITIKTSIKTKLGLIKATTNVKIRNPIGRLKYRK